MRHLWLGLSGSLASPLVALAARRGTLLPWAPVFLSVGIGLYFALGSEPAKSVVLAVLCLALLLWAAGLFGPELGRSPAFAMALIAGGFVLAVARAHLVAAPVLPFRYYGPVEGRIVDIDRSFSDQIRITLDEVRLNDVSAKKTPTRVRVALHGDQMGFVPEPGLIVMVTAHLAPPDGPVAPGGFDFQRLAWFSGLGAVGYARSPPMVVERPEGHGSLAAFRLRMRLSSAMQAGREGQAMAFASALMTGDRSGVTAETNEALRASNLSHMVSISGLHMGLLTGFVFALFRYGLALAPVLGLRTDGKKIAAIAALGAATFYLFLAGPEVATRRAYVMAAVMLVAVLFDRRAISLRSLAIAALICLVLEPESLTEPGFQMSFGATAALIAGFEQWTKHQHRVPAALRPGLVMVLSSLLAGTATAPIAAAHFNRIAEYGLLANLLTVPVMGTVVMPAGVIAALLAPLGLAGPALWVMEKGSAFILWVAAWVSGMKGAVVTVPTPPDMVLPFLGFCGAALMIGGARWVRAGGAGGVVLALILWGGAERPDLLISGDGTLVGLMTAEGRALSKEKGGGFVAKSWLEDDGDPADQPTAAARVAFSGKKGALQADFADLTILVFTGKGSAARAEGSCAANSLVVLSEDWAGADGTCVLFDRQKLKATGALALYREAGGLRILSAKDWAGERLWNRGR
ncbi:ComEC/Rec2 family competence protein [Frigidibacter sp. RF13]|uniref:ComEC/Rec2 family competence protein n=1 Tax=Frigidibacter sp. RF13 TaxID=2997340 RepID=UPI0022705464|nr:ComEC/Rec2 family competence protein [Frigidibacter sp. RF13]MCY1125227.1 ComEC/Rec2 family competence protein [Frigidibacter sp. RF13]